MKTKISKRKKSIKRLIVAYVEPIFNDLYDCYPHYDVTINSTSNTVKVNY